VEGVPCLSPGTSYDGLSITYDAIGNPLTYRDGMSFTWNGRQMKTANLNGTSVSYKYNADGLRTYKKVGSTVHEYEYSGGKLFYEKRGDIKFYYRYDAKGNLAAFSRVKADGSKYVVYVICNSRGDVEELRNESGTLFARYVYDSWGNVIHIYDANGAEITSSTNIAVQNPIRYRGYYFDAESGLYYLQSRYYDPVTCRFVNADSLVNSSDVLGFNMYAYCGNNPVNHVDPTGMFWKEAFDWLSEKVDKFVSSASNVVGSLIDSLSVAFEGLTASLEKSINNAVKPNNIGAGTWKKLCNNDLASVKSLNSGASKALKVAAGANVAFDVGAGISENISKGSSLRKTATDATVDLFVSGGSVLAAGWAGSQIGSFAGSILPLYGNVIGAGAGFAVGIGIYIFTDGILYNGKSGRDWMKEGAKKIW